MEIRLLDESMAETYTSFLKSIKGSLLYYTIKFKTFLENLLACQSKYLVCLENEEIVGVLPLMKINGEYGNIYNSLPFFGSNGGILAPKKEYSDSLLEEYNRLILSENTIAASTIIENPFSPQDYSNIHCDYIDKRIGQWMDISYQDNLEDHLMNRFDSSTRRNIKKALRNEITVGIDNQRTDFLEEIHYQNMSEINGRPKPSSFFQLLPRHFQGGEDFNIYVARKNDRLIAALLLLYFNKTVEYYVPVVDKEYRTYQPLSLTIYRAMVDASKRGFSRWNWGGTWLNQKGVYRFKEKWGTIDQEYHYYIKITNKKILNSTRDELLKEYGYFYVIPFNRLKNKDT